MRTHDEIKKGLVACGMGDFGKHSECPYNITEPKCMQRLLADALAYIRRLEAENCDLLEERELNDYLRDKVKQLEAQVPKWISVQERLPEEYKPVLVYAKHTPEYFSDWSVVMEDVWLGDGWDCNADTDVHEVTHWMPLPEPPVEV